MAISDYQTLTTLTDNDLIPFANANSVFNVTVGALIDGLKSGALPLYQNAENAGKYMIVGSDGIVRPTVIEDGGSNG